MSQREREAHTLAGPYAMDAISGPDRARFERHLAGCGECAQEVASLREATARLAAATAVTPAARAQGAGDGGRGRDQAAAARGRAAGGGSGPGTRAAGPGSGWPWWRPSAAAAGGAVLFGVNNGGMRDQLSHAQASSQQVAAVLTARDATMMTGAVRGGGKVTIVMSHSMRELVFTAAALHALPASRGYELWLIGPAGDRAVIMLPAARHGMTGPVVASGLRPGDHLALTAEPAGGPRTPLGAPPPR